MKCLFKNSCRKKYICCNYCDNSSCDERCNDKHEECKFFYNIPGDLNNPEFCLIKPNQEDEVKTVVEPVKRGRGRPRKIQ